MDRTYWFIVFGAVVLPLYVLISYYRRRKIASQWSDSQKNSYLIALSESERTAFGRMDFVMQPSDQGVFSAIWALESEVNSGGFRAYFVSDAGDTANFAPTALDRIGAPSAAAIVRRALATVSAAPLPDSQNERQLVVDSLTPEQSQVLDKLDSEFLAYPDNLTERLFAFVASKPESFGQLEVSWVPA